MDLYNLDIVWFKDGEADSELVLLTPDEADMIRRALGRAVQAGAIYEYDLETYDPGGFDDLKNLFRKGGLLPFFDPKHWRPPERLLCRTAGGVLRNGRRGWFRGW